MIEKRAVTMSTDEAEAFNADLLDPFVLQQSLTSLQLLKVLIGGFILLPIRLLTTLLILVFAWAVTVCTLAGLPIEQADGKVPLEGWRRRIAKPFVSEVMKIVFFVSGWRFEYRGAPRAPKNRAPILLVCPHSSFMDTALVPALDCPGLVVAEITKKAPFFSDLIRFTQPLYVGRGKVASAIYERARSPLNFEQLMLFPEGGCGNRKALLQFKLGAFSPGVSVQPVFVRYPKELDTITWTWNGPGAWHQLFLTLVQWNTPCQIEFLPVYDPTEKEKKNPRLFAANVRRYISKWTGCGVTRFSVEDARFLNLARQLHVPPTAPLVKFLRARYTLGRSEINADEELHAQRRKGKVLEETTEALKDFYRCIEMEEHMDIKVYEACLYLIRNDMTEETKLHSASKVLYPDLDHLLPLLWRGTPVAAIINGKEEDKLLDSRNFL